MTKEEFTQQLRSKLSGIPQDDIEERISYYSEMIDDRMEDGLSEEEAVAGIGAVDTIVEHVMSEIPLSKIVREKAAPAKSRLGGGWIALIILGFPLWLPLLISAFAIILSLYITVWAIVISFYAVVLALAVAAIVMIPVAIMYFTGGVPAGGGFSIGAALICAGLAILFFLISTAITRGVIKLTGAMLVGIKRSFVGRKGVINE